MTLDDETNQHLEKLLVHALESFDGLCARWDELKLHRQYNMIIRNIFISAIFLAVLKRILSRGFIPNMEDP